MLVSGLGRSGALCRSGSGIPFQIIDGLEVLYLIMAPTSQTRGWRTALGVSGQFSKALDISIDLLTTRQSCSTLKQRVLVVCCMLDWRQAFILLIVVFARNLHSLFESSDIVYGCQTSCVWQAWCCPLCHCSESSRQHTLEPILSSTNSTTTTVRLIEPSAVAPHGA
jgi:hypothetical protein